MHKDIYFIYLNTFLCFSFFESCLRKRRMLKTMNIATKTRREMKVCFVPLGARFQEAEGIRHNRVEGLVMRLFAAGVSNLGSTSRKDHARAGRSGEHPEEGKEGFVLVIGKESVGKLPHIEISKNCPHKADYY